MKNPGRARRNMSPKRVLLLYGGWKGHSPKRSADFACEQLLKKYDVVRSQNLRMLRHDVLSEFDLLVPIWTFGSLSALQEKSLMEAVADGLGMVAWHGSASSFLNSRPHKFLLGGQFVGHPGGNHVRYTVRFLNNDPLVRGIADITFVSEQYYLLIDPAVKVLARSAIDGDTLHWLRGVQMPAVWKRVWGKGRVFYSAIGHTLQDLQQPGITELLSRAIKWACRDTRR